MDKKMMAVAVVAIVVIAGVAAFLVLNNGGEKKSFGTSTNSESRLTIFGNANGDDYIDQRDVDAVKAIIAGEQEATYFDCYLSYGGKVVQRSFADANADGKIDQADVDIIQNMVDRKQNMQVKFYDVDGVVSSCTYPLTTAAVGYKSNYEALLICGAADTVTYVCNQVGQDGSYAKWYQMFLGDDVKCYGSRFTPDYEVFKDDAPSYFLSGTRAWFDENMEETVAPLGMDVVRLPFWEDNGAVSAVITLGYLIGHEDQAYEYAEKADVVYNTINEALKDVALKDRPLVFASYNGTSISSMHNGIHELVTAAGGRTVIDEGYSKGSIDQEALALTIKPDWIILDQYYGFLETYTTESETHAKIVDDLVNTENKYVNAINKTTAYSNGNVLFLQQGIYMGPAAYIATAYVANQIWGDKFDFDVDAMFKDYIDTYHSDYSFEDFDELEYFDLADLNKYLGK